MISLIVNGRRVEVDDDPATPLLYVLRGSLGLNGAKYGCGLGQCGACTVIAGNEAIFSCITPISALRGRPIRTLEGLGPSGRPGLVQQAFIAEQAAQCGYCIPGMVLRAQALLESNPHPTDREIRAALAPHLCRCGTHMRILRAVRRASRALRQARSDLSDWAALGAGTGAAIDAGVAPGSGQASGADPSAGADLARGEGPAEVPT